MTHTEQYLLEVRSITHLIDHDAIERMAVELSELKGKLYIVGLGGSLANAIHMAADLRKLCNIDAEAFDNISEITARANDEGMHTIFNDWLSRMKARDALMVLSVGGGTGDVSMAIGESVFWASGKFFPVYGIVGPDGGMTAQYGTIVVKVPATERITPHTEAFQAVIWHLLVSHPLLQKNSTKW